MSAWAQIGLHKSKLVGKARVSDLSRRLWQEYHGRYCSTLGHRLWRDLCGLLWNKECSCFPGAITWHMWMKHVNFKSHMLEVVEDDLVLCSCNILMCTAPGDHSDLLGVSDKL